MTLPDQITVQELEAHLDKYEKTLDEIEIQKSPFKITNIKGGRVQQAAGGAARIKVNTELSLSYNFVIPSLIVQLRIETTQPVNDLKLLTTPSILIARNNQALGWLAQDYTKVHTITSASFTTDLTFLTQSNPFSIIINDADTISYVDGKEYTLPSAANAIYGQGELQYFTGQRYRINGAVPLYRPTAEGTLAITYGGVYANFIQDVNSKVEPKIRIGTKWQPLHSND